MKINVTIEIDDNELKKLFNLKSEAGYSGNRIGETENVSQYARFFDDGCTGWMKDPEYNLMFLRDQQRYANELLKSRGYLFLNEVYNMLGLSRSMAAQCVGWVYDKEKPIGDNFVDFGLNNKRNKEFIKGYGNMAILDFNVDGNILSYI